MEQGSEPGVRESFGRQRARLVLASEPGALTRNSHRFAGEVLTKSGSVRTLITTPTRFSRGHRIPVHPGHEIHGELEPGGDKNLIEDKEILNMAKEQ
jgi:hypothetical protein